MHLRNSQQTVSRGGKTIEDVVQLRTDSRTSNEPMDQTLPVVGKRGLDIEKRHMTAATSSRARHIKVRGATLKNNL